MAITGIHKIKATIKSELNSNKIQYIISLSLYIILIYTNSCILDEDFSHIGYALIMWPIVIGEIIVYCIFNHFILIKANRYIVLMTNYLFISTLLIIMIYYAINSHPENWQNLLISSFLY